MTLNCTVALGQDGTVGVDSEMIRRFFPQDCDQETADRAVARLARQSLTPFTQPPRAIAWRQKPATYFVLVVTGSVGV